VCDAKEKLEESMAAQNPGVEKHVKGVLLSYRISHCRFFPKVFYSHAK